MTTDRRRLLVGGLGIWLAVVLGFGAGSARAERPEGGTLGGVRGVMRVASAVPQPAGWLSLGTGVQFFTQSGMLTADRSHSRFAGKLAVAWAPWRFLEAGVSVHVVSDNEQNDPSDQLQVAVGEPRFVLKAGGELGAGVSLGGLADVQVLAGAGYFSGSSASARALLALLGTWSGGEKLPLRVHLNAGFLIDGSDALFDEGVQLSPSQAYAAGLSSFHRVVIRLGLEYLTRYVGPFVELSLEPLVGSGNPGFSHSPGWVSAGLKIWPTKSRSLELLAGVDVGIIGVGDADPPTMDPGLVSPVISRWNILFSLAYRLDVFAKPQVAVSPSQQPAPECPEVTCDKPTLRGVVVGLVKDKTSGQAVPGARITVAGQQTSPLGVDPKTGAFRSYPLDEGTHKVRVAAEGYAAAELSLEVPGNGQARADIALTRAAGRAGTLRGMIKDTRGRVVSGATVLVPQLDKTLKVGDDGAFSLSLEPGQYSVIISAPRRRAQRKTIRIGAGATVILNVELH